ncbi:MAG: GDSL-type esterase/lipase family protein [Planctomycetota bacterium]|jgi:lysophospholipase L1-like esterase
MDAEQHYGQRLETFTTVKVEPGGIVFVGSSHLEWFDTDVLLPGRHIVNRGIAGDRIGIDNRGILHRLDVSVFDCQPAYVLLENGANDLGELWRTGRPSIDEIAHCYERVVGVIRQRLPEVPVCVVNVLPTTGPYAGMSALVPKLNRHLERIAARHACSFMDFFGDVVNEAGELRGELTNDGLHLNERGYQLWAKKLEQYLPAG